MLTTSAVDLGLSTLARYEISGGDCDSSERMFVCPLEKERFLVLRVRHVLVSEASTKERDGETPVWHLIELERQVSAKSFVVK